MVSAIAERRTVDPVHKLEFLLVTPVASGNVSVGRIVVDRLDNKLARVVDATPAALLLGGGHAVVPSVNEGFSVFQAGQDNPFALEVDIAPMAGAFLLNGPEPVAEFGLFNAFLVVVPFLTGFRGFRGEDKNGLAQQAAVLVNTGP